ncbi:WD repeat-containing protein 7-like isoform X1 [Hydractinia symbiolongicarpus]|uniref:WD repeat-containing protein 7-like isoform X1 n=3 Tax=Hydractinia symbiolongicarpus TaxID=13093 RepID=UPI00254A25AB|nr:WD repeat-containing protein 7-like isoform X1 [Hydractinia symbiolongicarpus]
MSNSTSIVPLVLWGKKPPAHTISVITCTFDQKTIVTGTVQGQIGLWDLRHKSEGGLKVIPRNLLFAHGCKVMSVACALDVSLERPNVISLAENGELCLWDIEDGLCLQMNVIPGSHTALYSIQISRGSLKEWRLALHGLYSDVHILDSLSLQILYTLKSRLDPNWISSICTLRPVRKQEEMLIGITVSSCLKVWTLKPIFESKNETIYEEESKTLDCMKAKVMCTNPFTQRTVLIISTQAWQIFDASDFSFLAALPAPQKIPLTNGDFVATNRVLIWNKMGKAFLYRLPSRYLLGAEQSDSILAASSSRTPVPLCSFSTCVEGDTFDYPMAFSYGRRGPYYKLLLQGACAGISVWKVPDSEAADQVLSASSGSDKRHNPSEVTFSDEGVRKTILLDTPAIRTIPVAAKSSLKALWEATSPVGLIDGLEGEGTVDIRSSLYLPSQGKMVCGRSNGTIVIVDAIRVSISQLLQSCDADPSPDMSIYQVFHGHTGSVTCLLYPHDENPRYNEIYLISGGSDFTVRAWDLASGTLLHTFHCHGGEVLRLMVTPPECNTRFMSCICSVGQDHSVAVVGLRERKVVLLASRHTFPVETIRWRVKDDFMVVGCSDGSVYVWQMETGHLDRCVAGAVALEILEFCNEETSAPSQAVREHQRKFRLHHHLTDMAHQLPIDIKTPLVMKRMRSRMAALHHHVTSSHKLQNHAKQQKGEHQKPVPPLPPVRVCALRTSTNDPDIYVILLDPEALIKQLLSEEANYFAQKDSPANPKHYPNVLQNQITEERKSLSGDLGCRSYEIAQLLLSCIHGWGLDPNLDNLCISKLGMLKPVKPLSFGLLTRGRLTLMLPGWYIFGQEDLIAGVLEAGGNLAQANVDDIETDEEKVYYNAHWQLSSSITTQHLVSIVAVTNTLMSMNYVSFTAESLQASDLHPPELLRSGSMIRSEIKAGWSLLAALHCCTLPDAMKGLKYRPPLLHILARRWQDRCLEIREAAQAILLAELRRIGQNGRKQLIEAWSPHLPQDFDSADFGFEDLEQYMNNEDEKTVFVSAEEDRPDIAMVMMTTRKMVSSDIKLRHATAIIMLGVIGAEFQKEVDPVNRDSKVSEGCMDVTVVRNTAKALTTLLLQRQSSKTPAYSAIRRAAIDLIGRGFALWEPHIDVSHVLLGLFELCADIESRLQNEKSRGFSVTAAKDLHRSAKHSLSLIATARPSACITTLAKEVARHVATSSMSFTQPSPAAIAVYSHVRHQPPVSGESQVSHALHNACSEILRVMELMIEKNQQQVIEFIVEVVDIIVHMLDFKVMKDRGLTEVFPSIFKFSMVAYCNNTRRLAVGSRLGHIALYELRSSRCQLIPAHDSPITALAFSPEGKVLASFSFKDKRISFYQTSSSLLGMLSSTVKCIQSYSTLLPDTQQAMKTVRILWTTKKNVVLLLGDGSQHKFSI